MQQTSFLIWNKIPNCCKYLVTEEVLARFLIVRNKLEESMKNELLTHFNFHEIKQPKKKYQYRTQNQHQKFHVSSNWLIFCNLHLKRKLALRSEFRSDNFTGDRSDKLLEVLMEKWWNWRRNDREESIVGERRENEKVRSEKGGDTRKGVSEARD